MAASLNKALLIGRLGRDPEMRVVADNRSVCNFTLATDARWKDASGTQQEHTDWHRVTVWGRQAELVQQYLRKGSLAWVEGRIRYSEYTDREGQRRWSTDVVARTVQFLDKKDPNAPQRELGSPPPGSPAAHPPDTPSSPLAQDKLPGEDDVPF